MMRLQRTSFVLLLFLTGVSQAAPTTQPFLLHLPGIGGHLRIDDRLLLGLKDGGIEGTLEIHDWTGTDRGLIALMQTQRHAEQSTALAKYIEAKVRANPDIKITVTCHSAGAGLATWMLEKLPDDVEIDQWIMMQSALSPGYDLSKALRHVKRAYSFHSELDAIVLGKGTRAFGTVDGLRSDSAGKIGYTMPPGADEKQYAKLQQFAYEDAWMRFDHIGDHIGPMTYRFARYMIAPLLKTGTLPQVAPLAPTTRATTMPMQSTTVPTRSIPAR